MIKLCVIDTETTGLNYRKHGLIQFAGLILIDGEVVDKFKWNIKPFMDDDITEEALRMNNVGLEDLVNYLDPAEVIKEMKEFFYKYVDRENHSDLLIPVGYNVQFDINFIREFFNKLNAFNSYKNIFNVKSIDVMGIALAYFSKFKNKTLLSYKQSDVATALGINIEGLKLHTALDDSIICYEIYKALTNKFVE